MSIGIRRDGPLDYGRDHDFVSSTLQARWGKDIPTARAAERPLLPLAGWPAAATCGMVRPPDGEADLSISIKDIEAARGVIAGTVLRTPMLPAPKLSALTG